MSYNASTLARLHTPGIPRLSRWRSTVLAGCPVAFVLSTNLHRRHLNESQRAMVAVAVERLYAGDAEKRMRAGKKDPHADLREGPKQRESATKAATALNVSPRLVQEAKRVEAKAAPEVVAAVARVMSATPWRAHEMPRIWRVSATPHDWRKSPRVGTVAKCPNLSANLATKRRT